MPPERARRQMPVSCHQCRRRKARCDRQQPCTNCRMFNVQCEYISKVPVAGSSHPPGASRDAPSGLESISAENATIKARLQKLEDIVFSQQRDVDRLSPPTSSYSSVKPTSSLIQQGAFHAEKVASWAHETQWLEGTNAEDHRRTSSLVHPVTVRISSLEETARQSKLPVVQDRCVLVPALEETRIILRLYTTHVDILQHFIFEPHTDAMLSQLYAQISQGLPFRLSHVAFLLAMSATVAEICDLDSHKDFVFPGARAANDLALYWTRGSLDILEQAWRSQQTDLTTVQTASLLTYLFYHTEAVTPKVRHLHNVAINLAKEIKLHMTDDTRLKSVHSQSHSQIIEKELCRRTWWHLAALDWTISMFGGPQEGTYSVNLKHMRVHKPRNITDDDLISKPADFHRPLSEHTRMSYHLCCVRFGEVCREITDALSEIPSPEFDEFNHFQTIVALDEKFGNLLVELPEYFGVKHLTAVVDSSSWTIKLQRYYLNLTIESRRCKLHLPYLIRAARNPRFTLSRTTCLNSVRSILKIMERIPGSQQDSVAAEIPARLVGFLHHLFFAVVVLIVDHCVNQTAGDEEERRAEIQSACRMFENARRWTASAGLFLDTLTNVMRKHKLRVHPQGPEMNANRLMRPHATLEKTTKAPYDGPAYATEDIEVVPFDATEFNDLWQEWIHHSADVEPQEWDAIFASIDTTIQ